MSNEMNKALENAQNSAQNNASTLGFDTSHVWKHSTKVAGVEWKNMVGTASGTFQLAACAHFYDVSQLGAICTKGVSPVPWEGNPSPRTAESPSGMVNAVGLQNPGVDHYLVDELPKLKKLGALVITNVAGHSDEDYAQVVEKLADSAADMLEINVSCPNVTHGGMSVGTDPVALHRLIKRLRAMTDKPMIVKMTPNVTDIVSICKAAVDAGADALSMINTLVGLTFAQASRLLQTVRAVFLALQSSRLDLDLCGECVKLCQIFQSLVLVALILERKLWNICMLALML